MKALVYTATEEMSYREEPEPIIHRGDALVAVEAVGVCGSDLHAYLGHDERRVPPLILGHEAVGTVLEGTNPGQRVVLNPLITCGVCEQCSRGRENLCSERELIGMRLAGAYAERIAIPERNVIVVPDGMPSEHAALTEPAATGLHAIALAERVIGRPWSQNRVLVFGAGSVGLLAALLLQHKGASGVTIVETNPLRRSLVAQHCDLEVVDPAEQQLDPQAFDAVFDGVGGAVTRNQAIAATKSGGVVMHIGLMDSKGPLDVRAVTLREIAFIGTYTYTPSDMSETLEKLRSGAFGSLGWVETRPLRDGAEVFRDLVHGRCPAPKVVLRTAARTR